MSAQHTPGPWHREGNHIVSARGVRVAVMDTPAIHAGVDNAEADANAERVVQCVNAHDELVAELKATANFLQTACIGITDSEARHLALERVRVARAAIAKATGSSNG